MTIAALQALLKEIDEQGGPETARQNGLHLPEERTTRVDTSATTVSVPATVREPEALPVGKLLAWGDAHLDPEIQDQAARTRAALVGLRTRYAADQELASVTAETEQLEKRLAELRAREAELAPAKSKKPRAPVSYPAAEVRAWAATNAVTCPAVGRVPKAVVDAWRSATGSRDGRP